MKRVGTLAILFVCFAALCMLISLWIGNWFLLSVPVLVVSLALAFFLAWRFPIKLDTPPVVLGLVVLMLVLTAYPLILVHPFFPASSDVLHVTHIRILDEKIPDTYAPYSDIRFTYQIGFALFSNALADLFGFVPDYILVWLLGVVFSGLIVLFCYWLVFEITGNPKAALVSAVLVFGSKFIFTNFYFGVFPLVSGFAFFLATVLLFEKKNPVSLLLFPATVVLHPFTGVLLAVFLAFWTIRKKVWSDGFRHLLALVLALPALLVTYLTVFSNATAVGLQFDFSLLVKALVLVVPWLGVVSFGMFVASIIWARGKPKTDSFLLFALFLGVLSILFFSLGLHHADKFFWLLSLFAVLCGGFLFSTRLWEHLEKRFGSNAFKVVSAVLLVLCLASFFLSGELVRGRSGSKATVEGEAFAMAFKQFDPSLKTVVFLAKGGGWIAALSEKIPFDVRADHFVQDSELQVSLDSAWETVAARHALQKRIESDCTECVLQTNADYLVVNQNEFGFDFDWPIVFEHGSFRVYQLGQ